MISSKSKSIADDFDETCLSGVIWRNRKQQDHDGSSRRQAGLEKLFKRTFPSDAPVAESSPVHNLPYTRTLSQRRPAVKVRSIQLKNMPSRNASSKLESEALNAAKEEWKRRQELRRQSPGLLAPFDRAGFAAVGRAARRLALAIQELPLKDINYLASYLVRLQLNYPRHADVKKSLIQLVDHVAWIGAQEGRKSGAPRDSSQIDWLHIAARHWVQAGLKLSTSAKGRFFNALCDASAFDSRLPTVSAGTLRGNLRSADFYLPPGASIRVEENKFKLLSSPPNREKVKKP